MSKIRIKNFGPIKEGCLENNGWIDIKKVTVFIGNQGSGKSTVAKVISTLTWLEKSINRGDINKTELSIYLFKEYFKYQGIFEYFHIDTEIDYHGDKYSIKFYSKEKHLDIYESVNNGYTVPKIMYIPAERNTLSTINNIFNVTGMPDHLFTFAEELKKAQKELNGHRLELPINNYEYEYDEATDSSYVIGQDHEINLLKASSGLQSLIPLYLVSRNLARLITQHDEVLRKNMNADLSIRMNDEITSLMLHSTISEQERDLKLKFIRSKYLGKCFVNIVEEPEQNLFPTSQWQMLQQLLEFNNLSNWNKLIITTHSPYIINYLSIAIQGADLVEKIESSSNLTLLSEKLNKIVPIAALVPVIYTVIYQLDETNGTITRLPDPEGIPSDKNYLNQSISEGNRLFDALLEIEEEL
ncbi:MAG: ATP-binding protein [Prolixibacteraceae bacterium]|nr:ATP-binding protein [Prolixibacteraceae bacterium]